ncbi:MAG TPA: ABC transporter permease subunit [Fimbriimonadaceae bacterium]|nr:ABC transporter permease subunit [Fimbriimonadaceae bacterium]
MSNAAGPIADLSYRTYGGILQPPTQRWKVIAREGIRRTFKNKWYWWCLLFGGWYFGVMTIALFVVDQLMQSGGRDAQQALSRLGAINWSAQFLHGFSYGQLFFMFVAMIAGAGAIANDNRANALLVYLSKPCTKKDYLIGKWVGVFIPVVTAMLLPALIFYLYGALNYRDYGFLADDPWLILRVLLIAGLASAFHASLVLGVSSLFNQGRMANMTYVGVYFITYMVTVVIGIIVETTHSASGWLTQSLFYCSIDGVNIGVAKIILNLDSPPLFMGGGNGFSVDRPSPILAFGLLFGLSAIALRLVWKRVRAVEVVG